MNDKRLCSEHMISFVVMLFGDSELETRVKRKNNDLEQWFEVPSASRVLVILQIKDRVSRARLQGFKC